jgi:hypothetical protein
MYRGYFALWRKIEDHPFYKEPREFSKLEAWIDILKDAQHAREPQEVIIKMRLLTRNYGECLKSVTEWADKWKWSRSKVFRYLKLLKKMKQIDFKSETVTTRITVINYEHYDPRRNDCDTQVKHGRNASETRPNTNNNDKNEKNEKNVYEVVNTTSSETISDAPVSCPPQCPHQKIIEIYHEVLPELPYIQEWDTQAAGWLKKRWREKPERQNLEFWRQYFAWVKESDFLMGRSNDFNADLRWLVRPSNFAKVVNGNYHNKRAFHDKLVDRRNQWLKKQKNQETSDS